MGWPLRSSWRISWHGLYRVFDKWYGKTMPRLSKRLPLTKAWAIVYFGLAVWVGSGLYRAGILPW